MKGFSRFLVEAEESKVAAQAKRLNLKSDGHGGWLDVSGKYVAKTEKGKLKFFGKRGGAKEDPQTQTRRPTPEPIKTRVAARPGQVAAPAKPAQPETAAPVKTKKPDEVETAEEDTITVAFGRFNPPTIGHEKLLKAAQKVAVGGALKIYPSRSQDPKKNPLDPDMKVSFMRKMFPEFEENIVNDSEMKSIFNVLITASEEGYKNVNIVVGADRQAEFENLATKYNGDLYDFDEIRVVSAGVRDADAEGVEGMSASKLRKAVVDDDFESFKRGVPKGIDDGDKQALYNAVRQGMKIKAASKVKEDFATWQIAPRDDQQTLREKYVTKQIFRIGDLVENLNTGLVGKIMRRGTNYLICVTEQNNMFKSWIRDVMEAVVNYPGPSGVPASQREIGTDSHRDYVMRMTGTQNIRNFINKYRKNKK